MQRWTGTKHRLIPIQLLFSQVNFFCAFDHVLELDGVLFRGVEVQVLVVHLAQLVDHGVDVLRDLLADLMQRVHIMGFCDTLSSNWARSQPRQPNRTAT
jgi:hypothetical protein